MHRHWSFKHCVFSGDILGCRTLHNDEQDLYFLVHVTWHRSCIIGDLSTGDLSWLPPAIDRCEVLIGAMALSPNPVTIEGSDKARLILTINDRSTFFDI